jgi:hypothetical protein
MTSLFSKERKNPKKKNYIQHVEVQSCKKTIKAFALQREDK